MNKFRAIEIKVNSSGFTLVELLVSLSILVAVLVPVLISFNRNRGISESENEIIATCILEQEAAMIRKFPNEVLSVKRRMVAGREWLISIENSGDDIIKYRIKISDPAKYHDELVFYGRGINEE